MRVDAATDRTLRRCGRKVTGRSKRAEWNVGNVAEDRRGVTNTVGGVLGGLTWNTSSGTGTSSGDAGADSDAA